MAPSTPGLPTGQYPYLPFPPAESTPSSDNGQNGGGPPGFMMFQPTPGMIYYPAQTQSYNNQVQNGQVPGRTKRKQVKMACTNCATACKRCDERRPCERCIKYNISESCVDGHRKERKKGIKRGPYKRKSKVADEAAAAAPFTEPTPADSAVGGWRPTASVPTTPAAQVAQGQVPPPPPPMQGVSQFVTGEGFFPMFYPPPGFMPPPPHDGQPPVEGAPPHPGGPPPNYWMPNPYAPFPYPGFMHPGPPQPHAAHPHAYPYPIPYPYAQPPPQVQGQPQPQGSPVPAPASAQPQMPPPPVIAAAADPVGVAKSLEAATSATGVDASACNATTTVIENGATNGKKRGRAPKAGAEAKPKKVKRVKALKNAEEAGPGPSADAGEEGTDPGRPTVAGEEAE